jgi:N-acetylglutamate synthase
MTSRFDPEVSFAIERVAMRAWPAEEVEEVDGWWLRRTLGVARRRSNSLLPPADSAHAVRTLELALATAEELGFEEVVQVSPAEVHLRLDESLEDRGMKLGGRTLVLAGEVGDNSHARPRGQGHGHGEAEGVRLGGLEREWVEAWAAVGGGDGAQPTAELVLSQLGERARFARVDAAGGEPLAVGIGVVEEGWLGVFSLTVMPAARRRGLASVVMDAMEGWAAGVGARGVYLQVEADNDAALALYARRGMHVAHSYHYRSA